MDGHGHSCSSWAGIWDCSKAVANFGYSVQEQQMLLDSCRGSCRLCVNSLDGERWLYPNKEEEPNWANWWADGNFKKVWIAGHGPEDETKKKLEADKKKEEADKKKEAEAAMREAAKAKAAAEKAAKEAAAAKKAKEEKKEEEKPWWKVW